MPRRIGTVVNSTMPSLARIAIEVIDLVRATVERAASVIASADTRADRVRIALVSMNIVVINLALVIVLVSSAEKVVGRIGALKVAVLVKNPAALRSMKSMRAEDDLVIILGAMTGFHLQENGVWL